MFEAIVEFSLRDIFEAIIEFSIQGSKGHFFRLSKSLVDRFVKQVIRRVWGVGFARCPCL